LLLCVLGLSPFTKKPAEQGGQRRSPSGGTASGPLWKQAVEGERLGTLANGFGNITKRGAGDANTLSLRLKAAEWSGRLIA